MLASGERETYIFLHVTNYTISDYCNNNNDDEEKNIFVRFKIVYTEQLL